MNINGSNIDNVPGIMIKNGTKKEFLYARAPLATVLKIFDITKTSIA
jgi:hypothetical protein